MSKNLKRILMASVGAIALAGAGTFGWYWVTTGRFLESTDDAYVQADYTTIAPKVSGYIAQVAVEDNQPVKAGQVLARIDDRDYRSRPRPGQGRRRQRRSRHPQYRRPARAAAIGDRPGEGRRSSPTRPRVKFAAGRLRPLSQADRRPDHGTVQDEQRAETVLQQQTAELQSDRAALVRRASAHRRAEHRARQGRDPGHRACRRSRSRPSSISPTPPSPRRSTARSAPAPCASASMCRPARN